MSNPQPSSAGEPISDSTDSHQRDSVWASVMQTCRFLNEARHDKTATVREQDKLSTSLLGLAFLFAIGFLIAPAVSPSLRALSLALTLVADVLYAAALVWFVARRFGILRTMPSRHAVLCAQLMLGAGLLAVVLAVNVAAIVIALCLGNHFFALFS